MGLLTPCFVPGEGFLYTIIVPGGGFLLPSSRVPGVCPGGGWFWMKLIPALFAEVVFLVCLSMFVMSHFL